MSHYRTPLGRARGLGSAKDGVGRFLAERVTAAALVILVIWALASALVLARGGYAGAVMWLGSPVNAVLLALLAVAAFYHMQMGVAVIIEDYIHRHITRTVLLLANAFACWGGMALTILCVLKVALIRGGL